MIKRQIFSVMMLFTFLMGPATWPVAWSAPACISFFQAENSDAISKPKEQDVEQLNSDLNRRLQVESRSLEESYRQNSKARQIDTLVVGGGVHASIFASASAQKMAHPSVLIVEAGDVVSSIWGTMAGEYLINSSEPAAPGQAHRSANRFPHSPLKMKSLADAEFHNSRDMALMASGTEYSSAVPILLGNRIVKIIDLWNGADVGPGYHWKVVTSSGLDFEVNNIIDATGLGDPRNTFKDQASRDLVERETHQIHRQGTELNGIMTSDDFLRLTRKRGQAGKNFVAETENQNIAVIAAGDGGKISVEKILSSSFSPTAKITWIAQKATTPEEFRKTYFRRYHPIADQIGQRIRPVTDYATRIERLPDGTYNVICDATNTIVNAKYVVIATGYENNFPHLLVGLDPQNPEATLVPEIIKAPLVANGTPTAIGVQFKTSSGKAKNIFRVGVAAVTSGPLATPEELKETITQNPVSIEVLGPRTAAMARRLVQGKSATTVLKGSATSTIQSRLNGQKDISSLGTEQRGINQIKLSLELARVLRSVDIAADRLSLRFKAAEASQIDVLVTGLEKESAAALVARLQKNRMLLRQLQVMSQAPVEVIVPVVDSRADVENMVIH